MIDCINDGLNDCPICHRISQVSYCMTDDDNWYVACHRCSIRTMMRPTRKIARDIWNGLSVPTSEG